MVTALCAASSSEIKDDVINGCGLKRLGKEYFFSDDLTLLAGTPSACNFPTIFQVCNFFSVS